MAGLLSRFTTFVPNATILSNDHNQELNRIVNLLNGTTTNLKTVLKTSDAGDPPLELDQLSTGPILKGFQGGIEKFRFRNDGALRTPGIYDSNDNEELLFVTTPSAVNEWSMANAATGNRPTLSLTGGDASVGGNISPKGASGQIFITGSMPLRLPTGVSPTNDDDAARKKYVDDARTRWSVNWLVYDPSTFPTNSVDQVAIVKVPGAFVATHIGYIFVSGSASGSFDITIAKRNSAFSGASQVGIGTMTPNPGTINTPVESDVGNVTFAAGDYVFFTITNPSSPLQRSVSFFVRGYKLPETGE